MDLAGGAVFEGDAAAEGRGRLGALKNGKGGFLNRQGSRVRDFQPFSAPHIRIGRLQTRRGVGWA